MFTWHFFALNIALPVILLIANIIMRWPSNTAASAGNDWVLLLLGLDLATLGTLAMFGVEANVRQGITLWLILLIPAGVACWVYIHKHFEPVITSSLVEIGKSASGKKTVKLSGKALNAYVWSIVLPASCAAMNAVAFLGTEK
ncbi:hypothetical protein [Pollutimonas sp. M17]|uniref:hypothetical protein n=1 Tax=Pollutimonas sp. M17 TaxID=2962065 RepID=UPI0021F48208|nr:hypothetical protein [Pollutimonas sp. M17]UYO93950.1 hypothetical protein OEG81_01060 [Pollutimonas sp. M17]